MLHHKAPHRAWEPDERNKALFKDRVIPEPDTLWDDYATRPAALPENEQTVAKDLTRRDLKLEPPADLQGPALATSGSTPNRMEVQVTQADGTQKTLTGKELVKWKYQRYMQDYLACVQGVDDGVGKVLDYLDQTGLAKNTIVFYSADNGWYLGDLGLYDKRFMYEPGLRVPLLARGPGIKAGQHARRSSSPTSTSRPPSSTSPACPSPTSMQGRSLVPLLRGESPADWRTSVYYRYYHDPGHHNTAAHFGVRTATHKLIYYWKKDAYETVRPHARTRPSSTICCSPPTRPGKPEVAAKFAELKAEIARLQKEYKDDGQYADPATWPAGSADGPFNDKQPLGIKTVAEAIATTVGR